MSQIEEHVRRHAGILSNAEASILVTVTEARVVARLLEARVAGVRRVLTVAELKEHGDALRPAPIGKDDIAFIQYTSGSTGDPKGVVITHGNLMANIRAMGQAVDVSPDDVLVSWLPLYHDMGLISMWLSGLHFALPLVVMSPLAFLARPERWLRAIQRYRGTISAAPNFAYELCVKRIDDGELDGLDLRSWRIACNGAEPVLPETLHRFTERFSRYGFQANAMTPVYGLAECTVGLLCPPLSRGPRVDRVRREPFSRAGRAEPAAAADASALRFVCCGCLLPEHDVRIVDALGHELAERVEGRLEFRGPSATRGYYRNPEQTRRLFDGEWLDSGDRAYVADGEVHLTGRVKDIIIRGGRNIFPHEVEDAVGTVPGARRGCIAVFGSPDPNTGTERLVVLAETRETGAAEQSALHARIVEATVAVLGEPPDDVALAPPHTVLKTSSGKIRRAACRELYETGRVGVRERPAWWQVIRLIAGSLLPQVQHAATAAAHVLHGLYAWLVLALIVPPTWLLTTLAPSPAAAWRVNRLAARFTLRLAGITLTVNGLEHLPHAPCVLVANHASYLDGVALFAALPPHFSFVAKRELRRQPLALVAHEEPADDHHRGKLGIHENPDREVDQERDDEDTRIEEVSRQPGIHERDHREHEQYSGTRPDLPLVQHGYVVPVERFAKVHHAVHLPSSWKRNLSPHPAMSPLPPRDQERPGRMTRPGLPSSPAARTASRDGPPSRSSGRQWPSVPASGRNRAR
jgi:acyl-CoA synthetase (AMP-forming)/AMP-acid ligase II